MAIGGDRRPIGLQPIDVGDAADRQPVDAEDFWDVLPAPDASGVATGLGVVVPWVTTLAPPTLSALAALARATWGDGRADVILSPNDVRLLHPDSGPCAGACLDVLVGWGLVRRQSTPGGVAYALSWSRLVAGPRAVDHYDEEGGRRRAARVIDAPLPHVTGVGRRRRLPGGDHPRRRSSDGAAGDDQGEPGRNPPIDDPPPPPPIQAIPAGSNPFEGEVDPLVAYFQVAAHRHLIDTITAAVFTGLDPVLHLHLITGARGAGKTTVVRGLAEHWRRWDLMPTPDAHGIAATLLAAEQWVTALTPPTMSVLTALMSVIWGEGRAEVILSPADLRHLLHPAVLPLAESCMETLMAHGLLRRRSTGGDMAYALSWQRLVAGWDATRHDGEGASRGS